MHDISDKRAYVTNTIDNSSGYLPISVIDCGDVEASMNTSFNQLGLDESVDPSSTPNYEGLPKPNPEYIKMKPKLTNARRFALGESPDASMTSPDLNMTSPDVTMMTDLQRAEAAADNNDELDSSRFEFQNANVAVPTEPQVSPETNVLVQSRNVEISGNVQLNQHGTTLVRFSASSRPTKHGSKPTLHYKYKGVHYKALWNSISKNKTVFKCHDCKSYTSIRLPEEAITFYRDTSNRKRFIVKADYKWDTEKLANEVIAQDGHQCNGRASDDLVEVYEKILSHSKIYINDLKEPSRTLSDDVLNFALRQLFGDMGEKYIQRLFESNKDHQTHIRCTTDKIDTLLKSKRQESASSPENQEDLSMYKDTLFEIDEEFYHQTGLKLFFNRRSLKYLTDKAIETSMDATFPFTKTNNWYQLLKIRCFKKNVSSLVMYCAMKTKAYAEYELIMERLKTLADVQSFEAKIFSTDMEASLIKVGKVYFGGSTIHRTCSKGFNCFFCHIVSYYYINLHPF